MKKVRPGEGIRHRASEWNEIAEATNHYTRSRRRQGFEPIMSSRAYLVNGSDIILGTNGTGSSLNQFDAVVVSAANPGPETSPAEWHQKITVDLSLSHGKCEPIGICQEAIPPGAIGRVMVSGVSPCLLTMNDATDDIAVGESGSATLVSRGSTTSGKVGGTGLTIIDDAAGQGLVSIGKFRSCHATHYIGTLSGTLETDDEDVEVGGLSAMDGKATTDSSITAENTFGFEADSGAAAFIVWNDTPEQWELIQVACPE